MRSIILHTNHVPSSTSKYGKPTSRKILYFDLIVTAAQVVDRNPTHPIQEASKPLPIHQLSTSFLTTLMRPPNALTAIAVAKAQAETQLVANRIIPIMHLIPVPISKLNKINAMMDNATHLLTCNTKGKNPIGLDHTPTTTPTQTTTPTSKATLDKTMGKTTVNTHKVNNNNNILATMRLTNMDRTTTMTMVVTVAEIEIVTVIVTLTVIVTIKTVHPLTTLEVLETPLGLDLVTQTTEKNLNNPMKTNNLFKT
jgi:hypothetical protein